jgi:hypothetical protein
VFSGGLASERTDPAFNGVRDARKTDRVGFGMSAIFGYLSYETSDGPLPLGMISQITGHRRRRAGVSNDANVDKASIAVSAAMLASEIAKVAPNIAQPEA